MKLFLYMVYFLFILQVYLFFKLQLHEFIKFLQGEFFLTIFSPFNPLPFQFLVSHAQISRFLF